MSIFEYDQEKHMRMEREEAWEEGHAEGFAEGQTELLQNIIRKKLKKGENVCRIATDLEAEEAVIRKFVKEIEEAEEENT